jgi:CheY-like chemotaxis protein
VIERNGRNPRRIKRFVNRFILDYQLDEASQDLDAELLIKLLIFETYFPDFARLFTLASDKNPIQEFLDFATAREQLREGGKADAFLNEMFRHYRIAPGETDQASLERLEQEVPEVFSRYVRDDDFLSLARSLESAADQDQILAKVQRRRERETSVPTSETTPTVGVSAPASAPTPTALPDVLGRRILWIDDRPTNIAKLIELLRTSGAQIEVAESGDDAAEILRRFTPDLLVSDVGRGGNPDAGFEDLLTFRNEGLYTGPVVFLSGRISAAKRSRAQEFRSPIVSDESELIQAIGAQLPPSPVTPVAA